MCLPDRRGARQPALFFSYSTEFIDNFQPATQNASLCPPGPEYSTALLPHRVQEHWTRCRNKCLGLGAAVPTRPRLPESIFFFLPFKNSSELRREKEEKKVEVGSSQGALCRHTEQAVCVRVLLKVVVPPHPLPINISDCFTRSRCRRSVCILKATIESFRSRMIFWV